MKNESNNKMALINDTMSLPNDILIVDDEIPNLKLLAQFLAQEGYQVRPAERPQLAIDSALAQPPALILLDVKMPEMDGFEVCRRLKQDERTRDIPIIFISALQDAQDKVRGFEAGGVDFVSKPFQEAEVLARVRTHMNLHNLQLNLAELVDERTAELAESKAALEEAQQLARIGSWNWDPKTDTVKWSKSLYEIFGLDPKKDPPGYEMHSSVYTPESWEKLNKAVTKALNEGQPYDLELDIVRSDGVIRHTFTRGNVVKSDDGSIVRLYGVVHDITELKRATKELVKSEAKYRGLVDNSLVGVFASTLDGRFSFVNDALSRIYDFDTPEQMVAEGSLARWADLKRREQLMAALQEYGSVANFEAETITNTGRHIHVLFSVKLFGKNIFGMIMDISDRKQAEEELLKSEDKFRSLITNIPDVTWTTDSDGNTTFISSNIKEVYGYGPEDIYAKPDKFWFERIHPEDVERVKRAFGALLESGSRFDVEYRIKHKDGNWIWLHDRSIKTHQKDGVMYADGILTDVTDRKQAQIELENSYREIEKLQKQLQAESTYLQEEIKLEHNFENIIGNSNPIKYALFKVEQVAETDSTVLVLGETGTGKELMARAVHHNSLRKDRPLIKLNCATLPANLIESELFGHEKGSFTGAAAKHTGRFEVADGSTLFLDEIGEVPIELQAKLLRVIEDGEFERLGSNRTRKVDVRIIAATNRDLEKDAREGRFRQDLWYRLNVYPITLPPLRDRIEDIPLILQHCVDKFARKLGKNITKIPEQVVKDLQSYSWPGNIRELENLLERAVINTSGSTLQLSETFSRLDQAASAEGFKSLDDMERDYIARVLEKTGGKVSGKNSAAEILGLHRSTLLARMKKLDIKK